MKSYLEFSVDDWDRTETSWEAWWRGELARPLIVLEALDHEALPSELGLASQLNEFVTRYPLDMPVEEVLDDLEPYLGATRYYFDSYPKWWANFGAGIVAAFFGSQVSVQSETTWFHPHETQSLQELTLEFDMDNAWWVRVKALTQAAVERWGERVTIGYTDLGGNLDILASLRGTQKLLVDLLRAPQEVDRLTREITRWWLYCYSELHEIIKGSKHGMACWAPLWMPGTGYMLQADIACMISPEMFARWVLPDLETCCDALEYPFYHLDGPGQLVHLDAILSIPKLRGVQWIPGAGAPPAEKWIAVLKRIRSAGKLCQVYVEPEGARKIVEELGGAGFVLAIRKGARGESYTIQEVEGFVGEIERLMRNS